MKTCYIFAIGGTGARIVTSLTHLLAAGSEYDRLRGWRFVPIMIDLDTQNGNLVKCLDTLKDYKTVYNYLKSNNDNYRFFKYPINNLKEIAPNSTLKDTFLMSNQRVVPGNNLEGLIDYSTLDQEAQGTQDLVNLLYTKKDRQMSLTKGFKGKPPIGAIFFEQLADLAAPGQALDVFEQQFDPNNDRIFIISSIFGGTGAAGFPWLAKFLRRTNAAVAGLQNAKIGALSVQPYFTVDSNTKSEINSNTFITKTKSALKYYSNHLQDHLNAIYYVGDSHSPMQTDNSEGGNAQKNRSSPIELMGATAILDFLLKPDNDPIFTDADLAAKDKSFGYSANFEDGNETSFKRNVIYWRNIQVTGNKNSERQILLPFLHFHLSSIMIRKLLLDAKNVTWGASAELFVINKEDSTWRNRIWDRSFLYGVFYESLNRYMEDFTSWLEDLNEQGANTSLAYHALQIYPDVGLIKGNREDKGEFKGIINGIITNKELTQGKDIILDLIHEGGGDVIIHGKHIIIFQKLIAYMNAIAGDTKKIVNNDLETQRAQRLMYMVYNASLELLKKQAANSLNAKDIL
jgi:hypothetical protein